MGFETYWEREPNYMVSLSPSNISINSKSTAKYVRENIRSIQGKDYCNIEGAVKISNFSNAPMHIEDTNLSFITFDKNTCYKSDPKHPSNIIGKCLVSDTASHVVDQVYQSDLNDIKNEYSIIIRPVDDQPLYGKTDAIRPFNISIPVTSFAPDKGTSNRKGLLIKVDQEQGIGVKLILQC